MTPTWDSTLSRERAPAFLPRVVMRRSAVFWYFLYQLLSPNNPWVGSRKQLFSRIFFCYPDHSLCVYCHALLDDFSCVHIFSSAVVYSRRARFWLLPKAGSRYTITDLLRVLIQFLFWCQYFGRLFSSSTGIVSDNL